MKWYGILKTALNALRRNVMRTLLTTLGIVIGVAAVITMMEIGNGATIAIQRTMASIGANTLVIMPGATSIGGINYGYRQHNDSDVRRMRMRSLKSAPPSEMWRRSCAPARSWCTATATGCRRISTAPPLHFLTGARLDRSGQGEAFTDHDVRNSSKVCLVGQTIVRRVVRRSNRPSAKKSASGTWRLRSSAYCEQKART